MSERVKDIETEYGRFVTQMVTKPLLRLLYCLFRLLLLLIGCVGRCVIWACRGLLQHLLGRKEHAATQDTDCWDMLDQDDQDYYTPLPPNHRRDYYQR